MRRLPVLLTLLLAHAASAVIIESGDGAGNTTPPPQDPGWDHVGLIGSLSAVYLGDGWVLTAAHVGAGSVDFGGTLYDPRPDQDGLGWAELQIYTTIGTPADLVVFPLEPPFPPLPVLPIFSGVLAPDEDLVLIGNGRNRGPFTSWDPNGHPSKPDPIDGYEYASGRTLRWGTNEFAGFDLVEGSGLRETESIYTTFDLGVTAHECQSAPGDSGGAVFVENGSQWELAGLLIASGGLCVIIQMGEPCVPQPPNTALQGNRSYAADLAFYEPELMGLIGLPEPAGGLPAGVALLGLLARSRIRRARRRGSAARR